MISFRLFMNSWMFSDPDLFIQLFYLPTFSFSKLSLLYQPLKIIGGPLFQTQCVLHLNIFQGQFQRKPFQEIVCFVKTEKLQRCYSGAWGIQYGTWFTSKMYECEFKGTGRLYNIHRLPVPRADKTTS